MTNILSLTDGSNTEMTDFIAAGKFQTASARMFSAVSMLNVPLDMVIHR